ILMTSIPPTQSTLIEAHNQEAQAVRDTFHAGQPIRPPVALGTGTQFFVFNEHLNRELGSEVTIHGGPNSMLLREANNLAPRTPFVNLNAMVQTARSLV
ncbi:MAG: hypothetical protein MUO62_03680, partial [Anaerolineales bacterium]|nr:hypothetical protein [Anaerolineales bacterium]